MHHSYIDKYARHNSPLHRLDARTKIISSILFVVLIAVTPSPGSVFLTVGASIPLFLCFIGRIPISYLLIRSLIIIPFAGFAALSYAFSSSSDDILWQWGPLRLSSEGMSNALILLLRSWIAVSAMILLVNTTPFDSLLKGMRRLKVPALFIMLLSFFYRFLYLLWDEVERMQRARNMRYYGGYWKRQVGIMGSMISSLFLRSFQRAEMVQFAMIARGWNGEIKLLPAFPLQRRDLMVLLSMIICLVGLWLLRTF
ncbi:cobalt ECF transporter T component CbiQ [candidate division LCP-89 bacterium B3_LCP]|uniref:Cobalt ECF transporter T component CbiQ n=1 Tax=candidate division LCP-89 bacterium B3_LCP TaxID=2012998 RepID=A0A532UYJ3_UNCL8|nr:MAG: cobalt ECF transporter T component CbiQ [candidate division LCP-89 bacterium B3_LCP]